MTMPAATAAEATPPPRVDWVDYAKGICIVMVVMMHSVLGVEAAAGRTGFMNAVVEFARPFRMPDFFLISGLFLALVIDRDWRTYLDRKVVHFAYFYALWVTIQFAFKAPVFAAEHGWAHVVQLYLLSYIEPFGTLWFIYMLPVFFVVIKLTKRVPPLVVWLIAAVLEAAAIHTGWTAIDEFCARFVYIYTGYVAAGTVFALARGAQAQPGIAIAALVAWALVNGVVVFSGYSHLPGVSLALGLAGAGAVIVVGALLAKMNWLDWLRYCGEHSIVIYLAFFLPMAVSRIVLLKSGVIGDVGTISMLVTAIGVVGALAIWWATRNTRASFLFERPDAFWIAPRKARPALQAAE